MNYRVLVLDPDRMFRARLATVLVAGGYEIEEGDDGRFIAVAASPAVLIVELLMPERDGLESIQAARTKWPDVRVIATTAGRASLSADYLLGLAAHLGADVILHKDAPLEAFHAALERLLSGRS